MHEGVLPVNESVNGLGFFCPAVYLCDWSEKERAHPLHNQIVAAGPAQPPETQLSPQHP